MRTLAEEILMNNRSFVEELAEEYPTYFDTNNLAITQNNYFLVASKYRLGTAQTNQFQSEEQQGATWVWRSRCRQSNGIISCDASNTLQNNELTAMPREYRAGAKNAYNSYYNWFAAVAESEAADGVQFDAPSSICPMGWGLPLGGNDSRERTWAYLFSVAYGLDGSALSVGTVVKPPINLTFMGHNDNINGSLMHYRSYAPHLASTSVSKFNAGGHDSKTTGLTFSFSHEKSQGVSVRCILKD